MKKIFVMSLAIFSFFIMLPSVKAAESYAIKEKCTALSKPNEQGADNPNYYIIPGTIKYLDPGDTISLVDGSKVASSNAKCSTDYYYVMYSGYKGYVCGDYINFNNSGKYYDELRKAGFPDSYLLSLNALKEKYPNWVFTAYKTNVNFEEAITNESNVEFDSYNKKYWSRSYIQTTNKLYLSRQIGSYNSNDTYNQMEVGGWYAANKQTVAYYMDPRNFLNIYDIFMFENLGYNSSYQTKNVISKIFNGTNLLQYVDYYIEAASANGNSISPIFLGARSRQEVVLSDGTLSDSANGKTGIYNFYNLGAYSSCENPVKCGLTYAANRGWNDARTAIIGGATEIAKGYINEKQNTSYFQRFNVTNNGYGNYSHQYMTSIEAPKAESKTAFDAYMSMNLLDSSIGFVIPVYENMPSSAANLPHTVEEIKEQETTSDINKLISELGYIIKGNFLIASLNKKDTDIINEMNIKGLNANINKVKADDDILSTGDVITVQNAGTTQTFTIVIKGDASGDGKVTAFDYLKIKNHIMEIGTLDGAYKEAADVDNNNSVTAYDYLNIKNYIMGNNSVLNG